MIPPKARACKARIQTYVCVIILQMLNIQKGKTVINPVVTEINQRASIQIMYSFIKKLSLILREYFPQWLANLTYYLCP